MFSCEFCEIYKNTFFYRTAQVAASDFNMEDKIASFESGSEYVSLTQPTLGGRSNQDEADTQCNRMHQDTQEKCKKKRKICGRCQLT